MNHLSWDKKSLSLYIYIHIEIRRQRTNPRSNLGSSFIDSFILVPSLSRWKYRDVRNIGDDNFYLHSRGNRRIDGEAKVERRRRANGRNSSESHPRVSRSIFPAGPVYHPRFPRIPMTEEKLARRTRTRTDDRSVFRIRDRIASGRIKSGIN